MVIIINVQERVKLHNNSDLKILLWTFHQSVLGHLKLQLNVVLKVLLVVGLEFLLDKICR